MYMYPVHVSKKIGSCIHYMYVDLPKLDAIDFVEDRVLIVVLRCYVGALDRIFVDGRSVAQH